MNNPIPTRIFEFLKDIPPFTLLSMDDLMTLCEQVIIQYLQPGEIVFRQGNALSQFIYVVHQGAVHLFHEENSDDVLVDQCDEGDIFGLRPVIAKDNYQLTARAEEESLLYLIRVEDLTQIIREQPKISWYLAQNFAAGGYKKFLEPDGSSFLNWQRNQEKHSSQFVELQSIQKAKNPVTCPPDQTILEAAIKMKTCQVGSIIVVNDLFHPVGIVTDRDLRNQAVTGEVPLDTKVDVIMSSPVITIGPNITFAEVQIQMMHYGIHHLCVTENGSIQSKVIGIISEHDLLVNQGNHPAILIREMSRCNNANDLKIIREKAENLIYQYLREGIQIDFISKMATEINDALISRAIELSTSQLSIEGQITPDVQWSWMALGSAGRGEQLLRTDQDHAIMFEDVPNEEFNQTQQYFLSLAQATSQILDQCGFGYCPAEMMAGNPSWCLSLGKWKKQFTSWIYQPTVKNVMFCSIFFDFRNIYGDERLTEKIESHIFEEIKKKPIFLNFMAKNAIQNPPPLTFFRNFLVEKSGTHKDSFDIKARAMMPLIDIARVLMLEAGKPMIRNTSLRFKRLMELEPQNRELFEQAIDAYRVLMRFRALQGLKHEDTGRYIDPTDLSKMERLSLRNCFRPISDLHELLQVRFQLSIFL